MHMLRSGALMGYTSLVSKLGHNPIHLLKKVGFTPAQLHNPNTYLSYKKAADLLDITAAQCKDPLFGFRLASTQGPMFTGDLAYGISVQETLGDSFRYANEHMSLHAQGAHLETHEHGDHTRWSIYLDFTNDWGLEHLLQMSVGQMAKAWVNTPNYDNRFSIHVQQTEPKDYEKVKGYSRYMVFDSEFDGMQFPTSFLSKPIEQNPAVYRYYFEQRIKMLEQLYPDSLPFQVKYLLSEALASGDYSLQQIAGSLNLHPRVLQRQLQAEGTSFSKLLQETRKDIACQHLRISSASITDLALKLGYAEVAIFSRHFKRWTGLSPREWRKQPKNNFSA